MPRLEANTLFGGEMNGQTKPTAKPDTKPRKDNLWNNQVQLKEPVESVIPQRECDGISPIAEEKEV